VWTRFIGDNKRSTVFINLCTSWFASFSAALSLLGLPIPIGWRVASEAIVECELAAATS
jgi:hypothetical protein